MNGCRWIMIPIALTLAAPIAAAPAAAAAASPRVAAANPAEEAVANTVRLGHYAQAESLATALVRARERAPGADSLPLATALELQADARRRAGHAAPPATLADAEKALAIRERHQGADHVDVSRSLLPLANVARARGQLERERVVSERALALREKAYGPDALQVAEAVLAVANARYDAGDYGAAKKLVERALHIRESKLGAESLEAAEALNFLGSIAYLQHDYPAERDYYERALLIRRKLLPPDHPDLAVSLNSMGTYFQSIGDFAASRSWREQGLAMMEKSLGPDHPALALGLMNHSMTVQRLGDFAAARQFAQRALEIRERIAGPDHEDTGIALARLAEVERAADNLEAALPLLQRSLVIRERSLGADHPSMAYPLHDIGLLYYQMGDYERAAPYYQRSAMLFERSHGPADPVLAQINGDLGVVLASQGRVDEAIAIGLEIEQVTREHLRLMAERLSERDALQYEAAMNSTRELTLSLAAAGRLEDDRQRRQAWELLIRGRSPVLEEMIHRRRAVWTSGDSTLARLDSSLTAARERLGRAMVVGSAKDSAGHAAALSAARESCEDAERALSKRSVEFVRDRQREEVRLGEIVAALPRGAALVGFARLPYFANFERSPGDTARRRPGKRIDSYMAFVTGGADSEVRIVRIGGAERVDRLVAQWFDEAAHGALASGRSAAVAEAAYRAAGDSLRRAIWDPVFAQLGGADQVYLVPDGTLHRVNFAALPLAANAGKAARGAPAGGARGSGSAGAPTSGGYLIEHGPLVHTFTSERDAIPFERPAASGMLAVGGPDYDLGPLPLASAPSVGSSKAAIASKSPGAAASSATFRGAPPACAEFEKIRFEALPHTVDEVHEVAQIYDRSPRGARDEVTLTGPAATEAAVKRLSSGRRILHLATHGFFVGEGCATSAPAQDRAPATRGVGIAPAAAPAPAARALAPSMRLSGLALAGANRRSEASPSEEDGVLTAEEIMALDLRGTEWAVLSACQTGAGDVATGEGVLGLCRAFRIAGARTVITSAYAVEDESARLWMASLYRHRIAGRESTAQAVRSASLDLLRARRAKGESTHPFHWAAFQAIGDWR
jgi:tetratricopeptide (TPR) repeat protein